LTADRALRWGILGSAAIAREEVGPAIVSSSSGVLLAVASRGQNRADSFAAELGAERSYAGYELLLHDPDIDAVYVPVPNALHASWVVAALKAGKHVLCEKPLGVDLTEVSRMRAAARRHGRLLVEGLMHRHNPRTRRLISIVRQGAIGRVRLVRSTYGYDAFAAGATSEVSADIRFRPALGGGVLADLGSYCVDAILAYVPSSPREVHSIVRRHRKTGVDTTVTGSVAFRNGAAADFYCTFEAPIGSVIEIAGDRGSIVVPDAFRVPADRPTRIQVTVNSSEVVETFPPCNQYREQVDSFARAVRGAAPPNPPLAETARNTRLLDAIKRSWEPAPAP